MEVYPEITIEDLVETYPDAISFLSKRGIACFMCGEPTWGTLDELARKKGVEDMDKFIEELIDFLENKKDSDTKEKLYIKL